MVAPASDRIPRVRPYSRSLVTRTQPSSPTGFSPSATPRSSGLRLTAPSQARPLPRSPPDSSNPAQASPAGCAAPAVWAPPRSLAATRGILSSPRGTEMFQFPRLPSSPKRECAGVPRAGCPIRIPPDHRPPAPPRGVSPRGRVLPRPPAPRHPPCALRAESHQVSSRSPSTKRGLDRRAPAGAESPRLPPTPTRADPFGRMRPRLTRPDPPLHKARSPMTALAGSPTMRSLRSVERFSAKLQSLRSICCVQCARTARRERLRSARRPFRPRPRNPAGRAWRIVKVLLAWETSNVPWTGGVEPRGFEPRTSAVQGRRSPG